MGKNRENKRENKRKKIELNYINREVRGMIRQDEGEGNPRRIIEGKG